MPFQSVTIDPAFPADWRARIESALPRLLYVLGERAEEVSVRWDAGATATETVARLQLTYANLREWAELREEDFADNFTMNSWGFSMWLRILKAQMKPLMQKIRSELAAEAVEV